MTSIDAITYVTVNFEGTIFEEDPIDLGGATNSGVTFRTWCYWLQQHGRVNGQTIAAFKIATTFDLRQCMLDVFVTETNIGKIVDERLRLCMIDYAINSGWVPAIKALQRVVGSKEDGVLGPITLGKANALILPQLAGARIIVGRMKFVQSLIDRLSAQKKYEHGWWKRQTTILDLVTRTAPLP